MAKTKKIWEHAFAFKDWRESKGLSQGELAVLLRTNQPHIARIEKNGQYPTVEVANMMKVHGFDFVSGKPIQNQVTIDLERDEMIKLRERVDVWKEAFTISQREVGAALAKATECIEMICAEKAKHAGEQRKNPHLQLRDIK